jgi:DDE superfamily endonuclease
MSGASITQTLDWWSAELGAVKAQLGSLFSHASVAVSAAALLDGLLGPERRKTGWMRAEAAGDPGPWRQQAVLGRSRWDADALRDLVRDYALATLAAPDGVLVIDETGFLKQGASSCGVQRPYTGLAGKIANCQIGVFAAYVSAKGHAFIDRRLYLPESWTDAPARLAATHVPAAVRCATMIGRADHPLPPGSALRRRRRRAAARGRHARAGTRSGRAVHPSAASWKPLLRRRIGRRPMGGDGQHLRCGRGGEHAAPGGQRLRARRHRHAPVPVLGQEAGLERHGGDDRDRVAACSLRSSLGR